jgi:preprotein translocase subunit SecG
MSVFLAATILIMFSVSCVNVYILVLLNQRYKQIGFQCVLNASYLFRNKGIEYALLSISQNILYS